LCIILVVLIVTLYCLAEFSHLPLLAVCYLCMVQVSKCLVFSIMVLLRLSESMITGPIEVEI